MSRVPALPKVIEYGACGAEGACVPLVLVLRGAQRAMVPRRCGSRSTRHPQQTKH